MRVIAITGAKNNGKTTAAEYLVRAYGFERISFATPLKDAAMGFGFPEKYVHGDSSLKETFYEPLGVTFREFATSLGSALRALQCGKEMSITTGIMYQKLLEIAAGDEEADVVIDDLRYPEEAEMLKKHFNAIIVRIERVGVELNEFSAHSSENAYKLFDVDYDLMINGTKEDLYSAIEDCMHPPM